MVLCALSTIHSVYGILTSLANAIAPPDVDANFISNLSEQLNKFEMPMEGFAEQMEHYYLNLMLNLGNYSAATFLFFSVQLIAVIQMFRMNRVGFALYGIAQAGLLMATVLFASFNLFGQISFGIAFIWNLIWILLYASQLKHFP